MNRAEIFEKITPIFQDVFDDDDIQPTETMAAEDVEEWDSLSHIRLIVSVEEALGIKFSAGDIAELTNVGQFVDLIEIQLAKAA